MSPKFIGCFVVATVVAGLPWALGVVPASAQAVAVAGEDDEQVKVVKLVHAEVDDIVPVLGDLFAAYGLDMTGVPASQCIVMRGPDELVQQAERIIEELDGPGKSDSAGSVADLIQVHSYPIEDMIRLLQQSVHGSRGLRLAADTINRQIVVSGTKSEVRLVRSLVEQVDQPTQALTADFYFLRGRTGTSKSAGQGALPAALQPIAATLAATVLPIRRSWRRCRCTWTQVFGSSRSRCWCQSRLLAACPRGRSSRYGASPGRSRMVRPCS